MELANASDPIARLKAVAALETARAVDGSVFEEGFVRHARSWAEAEGIPAAAFRTMGVPDAVLARAGFEDARRRSKGGRGATRAKSTSTETIQEWVLATRSSFTLSDVQAQVGGSPVTIKKAIDELTDSGKLMNLGAVTDHTGRGRAPYHYRLSD